jgi:hypothetical protein
MQIPFTITMTRRVPQVRLLNLGLLTFGFLVGSFELGHFSFRDKRLNACMEVEERKNGRQ